MRAFLLLLFIIISTGVSGQVNTHQADTIRGKVLNAADDIPLQNVNIINLTTVEGSITNRNGEFEIRAAVNDTLYFTYLGFKPIQVKITEDWKKYGNVKIKMTEVGFALEEVHLENFKLTGYLEIDAKNIPLYDDYRYQIAGMDKGYEAGGSQSGFSKALTNVFSPFDFLHNVFGSKPRQMRKIQKMKEDDEIIRLLENKYDRQTLSALLQINKDDLHKILRECEYSKTFIQTANDLQVLDAISDCYENYRTINKK